MDNKIAFQHDNILPNFNLLLPHINQVPLYSPKEHGLTPKSWPGKRSYELSVNQPFLFYLVWKSIQDLNLPFLSNNIHVEMFMHLRRGKDNSKDWIHRDNVPTKKGFIPDYSGLIYLNDTNLTSGTCLYDHNYNVINDFKYIQNRLCLFSSAYLHKGYGHFGNSSQNGRTTLNIFIRNAS
tara:strand:+ start:8565 stop:9104 length:540 start_codon:yes stop_codon:yes gene_type:complete